MSPITLNGVARFVIGDNNRIYTNVISGAGGFVSDVYNHAMILSAANTYTGPTVIGSDGNTPEVNADWERFHLAQLADLLWRQRPDGGTYGCDWTNRTRH